MKKFKLNPLAAVVSSLAVAGTAQLAVAQDDAPMIEEEEVIVTGFRRTLLNSIDAKRNADTIVEAISAEDIGGLPDASIADSLARLPGVTTERTGGEAGNIQIRGLSGDYVFATLNGREQVSPSDDRTIEFNQYPAELLSEVAVYKTPKASLIEGGVAGTVELRTSNPLDMSVDHKFHVSARAQYNDYAKNIAGAQEVGNRFTLSYQGKFFDETLGVALGYARFDQGSVAAEYNGLPWGAPGSDYSVRLNAEDPGNGELPPIRSVSEGFELHQTGGQEIRDGYMAAIQYEPNDNLTVQADVFLSEFESTQYSRGFIIQNLARFEIDNAVISPAGDIVGGQFTLLGDTRATGPVTHTTDGVIDGSDAVNPGAVPANSRDQGFQVNANDVTDTDEVFSTGFEVKWEDDTWELAFDWSRSEASGRNEDGFVRGHLYAVEGIQELDENGDPVFDPDSGEPVIASYVATDDRVDNLSFTYLNQPGSVPQITFNDAATFTNVDPSTGMPVLRMSTYERYPHVNDDEIDAVRIDGKLIFEDSMITSVEAGFRLSDRHYTNGRETFVYSIYDGDVSNTNSVPLSLADADAPIAQWDGDFSHLPSFPEINADAVFFQAIADGIVVDQYGEPRDPTPRARWGEGRAWSMVERADVTEEVFAAYIMANFETELFDRELTGNVGVRMVDTDQSAIALVPADPANGLPSVTVLDDLGNDATDFTLVGIGGVNGGDQFAAFGSAFVEEGESYTMNLPSLNLSYNLTDQDVLRFAAATVISRAPINRLANDITERYNRVTAGDNVTYEYAVTADNNPFLRPFEANQFDISYERYFEETEGALAIAAYYKDIQNRIQTLNFPNFTGWEEEGFFPQDVYDGQVERDSDTGAPQSMPITAPVEDGDYEVAINNDDAGYVQGLELSYTQTFTMLPAPFDTFGLAATYAWADSEITVPDPSSADGSSEGLPLPGLAENSGNITFFWEYVGVEARISANYQDEKVGELFNPAGGTGRITTFEAQTFVDFQLSYSFDFGMDVLFQISNLTDEMNKSFYGNRYNTATIQQFGRNFYLGVNYTFE